MSCRECVERDAPEWNDDWDEVGCMDGTVFGYCPVSYCGGFCEALGDCMCSCHEVNVLQSRQ